MKSVDVPRNPLPGNPIMANGYLIYGHTRPVGIDGQYEAYYWLTHPGEADITIWENAGDGTAGTHPFLGVAEAAALERGKIHANSLDPGRFWPGKATLETKNGFIIHRSCVRLGDHYLPCIEAERRQQNGVKLVQFLNVHHLGSFTNVKEAEDAARRVSVEKVTCRPDGSEIVIHIGTT